MKTAFLFLALAAVADPQCVLKVNPDTGLLDCGGGGGASVSSVAGMTGAVVLGASDLATFKPVRTSATVITIGPCTAAQPCVRSVNNGLTDVSTQVTTSPTVTITSGAGTGYAWIDAAGIKAGFTSGITSATCGTGCTSVGTVTGFPSTPHKPLFTATAASDAWTEGGITDLRSYFTVTTGPARGARLSADANNLWSVTNERSIIGGSGNDDTVPTATTENWAITAGTSGSTAVREYAMPAAGVLSNFYMRIRTSGGAMTCNVLVNAVAAGSPATVALTPSTAGNYSDTTNSITVVAGDLVRWTCANSSGSTSGTIGGFSMVFTHAN